jgi:hypothetical protein
VEGLSDALRRELIPWGIDVSRIHPSGVKGTEFNLKAGREGGIRFRSFPIGKVTREQMARKIVALVERPRRAVFFSRLYDVPAVLNRMFPGLVDLASSTWVRWKRRDELQGARRSGMEPAQHHVLTAALPVALFLFAAVYVKIALKWPED